MRRAYSREVSGHCKSVIGNDRERRKRAIKEMNSKLVELAERDSIYKDTSPMFTNALW